MTRRGRKYPAPLTMHAARPGIGHHNHRQVELGTGTKHVHPSHGHGHHGHGLKRLAVDNARDLVMRSVRDDPRRRHSASKKKHAQDKRKVGKAGKASNKRLLHGTHKGKPAVSDNPGGKQWT